MHSYQHNIKTFNNATRHLTRVERSLYRDLIELYYDTEQPLQAVDFDRLCRLILANTDGEKQAVKYVLDEFFILTGDVYTHVYCDEQIDKYRNAITAKAKAGVASAQARKAKTDNRIKERINKNEHVLNTCSTSEQRNSTNQEPITNNNEQETSVYAHEQESESSSKTKEKITRKKTFRQFLKSRKDAGAVSVFDRESKVYSHLTLQGMPSTMQYIFVFAFRNYYLSTENQKQYADWERQAIAAFDQNYSACRVAYRDSDNVWQLTQTGKNIEVLYKDFAEQGKIGVDYE